MTPDLLARLNEARRQKKPAALIRRLRDNAQSLVIDHHLVAGERLAEPVMVNLPELFRADRSEVREIEGEDHFVQVFNPPLRLAIIGAVHIAQALAPMARVAGYDVTVIDPRGAFASDNRFPDTNLSRDWPDEAMDTFAPDARAAVVTLTHDPKLDDPALDRALRSEAFYITALGSKRTHGRRLERLKEMGHEPSSIARIHGPAGLAIGAISPAEIAVAIMAQMTSVLRQGV
ncbi:MAG: XdhC family protein [Geminicoccaceae bacterium]